MSDGIPLMRHDFSLLGIPNMTGETLSSTGNGVADIDHAQRLFVCTAFGAPFNPLVWVFP